MKKEKNGFLVTDLGGGRPMAFTSLKVLSQTLKIPEQSIRNAFSGKGERKAYYWGDKYLIERIEIRKKSK